jgi:hypothetical protein
MRIAGMFKIMGTLLLCAASTVATAQVQSEIFVIQASPSGREPTIKIPVGAVSTFSANAAEALVGYADPQVEAMRLSGDVRITVRGFSQPIEIKADHVLLELTADETPFQVASWQSTGPAHQLRSTEIIVDGDDSQTFVGHVVFTVQTSAGAMQITADRVERKLAPATGA